MHGPRRTPDPREEALVDLGLTRSQAAAYLALRALGRARPREVAHAAGLRVPRVYEILADLASMGLAEAVPGPGKEYRAGSPEAAFDRLTRALDEERASLESARPRLEGAFVPDAAPPPPFVYLPGAEAFASAIARAGAERRSVAAALRWSTVRAAFPDAEAFAAVPWSRLVLLARPEDAGEAAAFAAGVPGARLRPAWPWTCDRVVVDEATAYVHGRAGTIVAALAPYAVETRRWIEAAAEDAPLASDPELEARLEDVVEIACDLDRAADFVRAVATGAPVRVALDEDPETAEVVALALRHVRVPVRTFGPAACDLPGEARRGRPPFCGVVGSGGAVVEREDGLWKLRAAPARAAALRARFETAWRGAGPARGAGEAVG